MELTQREKDLILTFFFSQFSLTGPVEAEVRSITAKLQADGAIPRNVKWHANDRDHIQVDYFI